MFRSGEIRWFLRGESPNELHRWFEVGKLGRSEPERTDEYLRLPDCETASVKLRDGKFEVKAQTRSPERVEYAGGIRGSRDTWVKWSSSAGDADQFRSQFVRAEDDWLYITKKRCLRLYSLECGEPVEIAVDGSWLSRGCQVELTDIGVRNTRDDAGCVDTWWSVSFESFGPGDTLLQSLDLVVPAFLSDEPPLALDYESSLSYPAWINRLGQLSRVTGC